MRRNVFSRRGAVRCETNAKLGTHWSTATVVGRPRAKERKFEKQIHRLRSRAHQGGRCSSTAHGIRKYGNSIRSRSSYASHRITSVESSRSTARRTRVLFLLLWSRAAKSFFLSSFLWPSRDFPTFAGKIIKLPAAISKPAESGELVTAKLIHDGRI